MKAPPEERDAALKRILAQPARITEAVYHTWVRDCFEAADLVLIMDTPVWVGPWPTLLRFTKRRLGLALSKRESFSDLLALVLWNHSYDGDTLVAVRRTVKEIGRAGVECRKSADALRASGCHQAAEADAERRQHR